MCRQQHWGSMSLGFHPVTRRARRLRGQTCHKQSIPSPDNISVHVHLRICAVKRSIMCRLPNPLPPRSPIPRTPAPRPPPLSASPTDLRSHPSVKYDITNTMSKTAESSIRIHYTVVTLPAPAPPPSRSTVSSIREI